MGLGLYLYFSGLMSIAFMSVESFLIEKTVQKRMFGGYILDDPTTYPYLVKLEISTNVDGLEDQFFDICSGALVDSQHVLTAAHCVMLINTTKLLPGLDVTVKAGWTGPGTGFEPIVRSVVEVEPNTGYRPGWKIAHDWTLLTLDAPYDLSSERVGSITWEKDAEFNRSEHAYDCVTMGWGHYDEDYDGVGDWTEWRGHIYKFFDMKKDWASAMEFCNLNGGYLAEVSSQEENDYLANNRPNREDSEGVHGTWIGLTGFSINLTYEFVRFLEKDYRYARRLQWEDFKGWDHNGEPNGEPGSPQERMCVALFYNAPGRTYGKWDDQDCSNANLDFWCEAEYITPISAHYSDHARVLDVQIQSTWLMQIVGAYKAPEYVPWEIYASASDLLFDRVLDQYRTPLMGDGGSPLVCKLTNKPGRHLVGVLAKPILGRYSPLFWFSNVANGIHWL